MFGEFIKEKRLALDLSLRKFCKLLDEDPSNWSKVERALLLPPQDEKKLKKIAGILQITIDSDDWKKLKDYSNVDSAKIPDYIMNEKEVMELLPAFFRTVGSVKPTKEEIDELIKNLKKQGKSKKKNKIDE